MQQTYVICVYIYIWFWICTYLLKSHTDYTHKLLNLYVLVHIYFYKERLSNPTALSLTMFQNCTHVHMYDVTVILYICVYVHANETLNMFGWVRQNKKECEYCMNEYMNECMNISIVHLLRSESKIVMNHVCSLF